MIKKYFIWAGMICFILLFVIGGDPVKNKKITLNLEDETIIYLQKINVDAPVIDSYDCDDYKCEFRMYEILNDNTTYNLGKHKFMAGICMEYNDTECIDWYIYNETELETKLAEYTKEWLDNYGLILKDREIIKNTTKTSKNNYDVVIT